MADDQFEAEWRQFVEIFRAEFVREGCSGGAPERFVADAADSILEDAKPLLRRLHEGEAPGRIIVQLCVRHYETIVGAALDAQAAARTGGAGEH